jgi:hypothetical protein
VSKADGPYGRYEGMGAVVASVGRLPATVLYQNPVHSFLREQMIVPSMD